MSENKVVVVPDIGGFDDVEVIEVHVKPGQDVGREDPLITLESDKASMDIPAPEAGRVAAVLVAPGDRVSEGAAIVELGASFDATRIMSEAERDAVLSEEGTLKTRVMTEAERDAVLAAEADATEVLSSEQRDALVGVESAPALHEIAVPDIGDFEAVEVIDVHVQSGDTVAVEDPLITLESDKAAMDIPAPAAGTIREVRIKKGAHVSEGDVIAVMESVAEAPVSPPAAKPEPAAKPAAKPVSAPAARPASPAAAAPAKLPPIDEAGFAQAHAGPSVRRLARELGVDLGRVSGSGVKARITADDVKQFVKSILTGGPAQVAALPEVPRVDFAKFGPVSKQKLTRIQKLSGPRLAASWVNLPHVTQHDEADTTDLEALRKSMKADAKAQGIRLTPLAFVLRAVVITLGEFPVLNSSLDPDNPELFIKEYFHLGFAADTPNGLVVPVIRDADKKGVMALADELGTLSQAARDGKLKRDQLEGGTFTVSSLGGIGGTAFTPIINAPEVAILGVSRSRMAPVYMAGEFVPRLMLPLSLSYDHRVIDGAMAVRFTTRLAQVLADADALAKDPA